MFTQIEIIAHLTIQNLQSKKSYQAHYTTAPLPYRTYQCLYLENKKMRYYFVDGIKVLPTAQIRQHLAQKNVPSCYTQWIEDTRMVCAR